MRDYPLGTTFDIKFTSRRFTTGAPFTLAGSPVISAYPDNSTAEFTAGITLSVDFDGRTGLNNIRVVATSGNGYAAGSSYALVITTGTVDGVSVVGEVVGEFDLGRLATQVADQVWDEATAGHTTAGSTGKALIDTLAGASPSAVADAVWDEALAGHVAAGSAGEALGAAGTAGDPWITPLPGAYGAGTAGFIVGAFLDATISSRAEEAPILARLPASLVGGRMDSSVEAISPGPVTDIADGILTRDFAAVTGEAPRSALNALRFLRNKWVVAASVLTVTKEDDVTPAWTAATTGTPAAAPITAVDPA